MRNKLIILSMIVLMATSSYAAELVNFKLANRRADGNKYLVDLVASVSAADTWTVSNTTLVLEYNTLAINPAAYDGASFEHLNVVFSGTDYQIFQSTYSSIDNYIALNILTTAPTVNLSNLELTIGSFVFDIVDSTKYDAFNFINDEGVVYDGLDGLTEGCNSITCFDVTEPWSRRIKPLINTPVLSSPTNHIANSNLAVAFDWANVSTATAYVIRIASDNAFSTSSIVSEVETTASEYNAPISLLNYNTTYYWQVSALNSTDTSYYSSAWDFKTKIQLSAPTLVSPSPAATDVAITANFDWSDVSGADKYHIQISKSSNFATVEVEHNNVTASAYSLASEPLSFNTNYYWRVRALTNLGDESAWATTAVFKTEALLPPVLATPLNNATNLDVQAINLTWNKASKAAKYYLEVATTNTFELANIIVKTEVNALTYSISNLNLNAKYFWRVASIGINAEKSATNLSEIRAFTTENLLPPTLTTPADDACGVMVKPTFVWAAVANADKYYLEVSKVSNFATKVYSGEYTAATATIAEVDKLERGSEYFWRVRSRIGTTYNSAWSATSSFVTEITVTLTAPADAATNISRANTTFTWNALSIATEYNIQIGTNATFATGILYDAKGTAANYNAAYLYKNTKYFWRVRAKICGVYSNWSEVSSLTTKGFDFLGLILPADNATEIDTEYRFYWRTMSEANSYDLEISKSSDFSSTEFAINSATTNYLISGMDYHTTYYWRVSAKNGYENSAWSDVRTFETGTADCEWTYTVTSLLHTISVPISINPTFANRKIANDDCVGVFFDDSGTLKCAGFGKWNGTNLSIVVYGDNPLTPEKDGFADDEAFHFILWDSHKAKEVPALATFVSGPEVFEHLATSVLASLGSATTNVDFDISLAKGWNMISSYVEPADNDIDVVFDNLSSLYLVKNESGDIYLPSIHIDNINTWNYAKGYLAYMTDAQTLTITGTALVPENTPLDIAKGWNMIGYLCNKSGAIATVLNTIYTNAYLIKNANGDITLPSLLIDNIHSLNPGEGYLVYMTARDTLTYPQNSSLKPMPYEPTSKVKYLKAQINSANNASLIITTSLPNDFEIGVYNISGELVGSGVVSNGRACIAIFGDDEYNDALTGAKQNEMLVLKAFNTDNAVYYNVNLSDVQSLLSNNTYDVLRYKTNEVLIANASTEADINLNTPILTVTPNPVSDFAEISVNTAITKQVTNANISLFDNTGKLIKTVYTGAFSMQNFKLQFDCTELSSGTYSVVLIYDGKQEVAKIIIQK